MTVKQYLPQSPVQWIVVFVLAVLIIAIGCTTTTRNPDGSVSTQGLDPVATQAIVTLLPQLIELAQDGDSPLETSIKREREAEMLEMKLRTLERILAAAGVYQPQPKTTTEGIITP